MKKLNILFTMAFLFSVLSFYSCSEKNLEPTLAKAPEHTFPAKLIKDQPIGQYNPETKQYEITASMDLLQSFLEKLANGDLKENETPYKVDLETVEIERVSQFIGLNARISNGTDQGPMLVELTENENGQVFVLYRESSGE